MISQNGARKGFRRWLASPKTGKHGNIWWRMYWTPTGNAHMDDDDDDYDMI